MIFQSIAIDARIWKQSSVENILSFRPYICLSVCTCVHPFVCPSVLDFTGVLRSIARSRREGLTFHRLTALPDLRFIYTKHKFNPTYSFTLLRYFRHRQNYFLLMIIYSKNLTMFAMTGTTIIRKQYLYLAHKPGS
jgi:hypothetical protein